MNKDLRRLVLACIIGSLAVLTGCGQKNDGMRKSRHGNCKQQMQDSRTWMDDDKDSMKHQDKDDSSGYNGCG